MTRPIRLAVVGAGIMGSNHARVARTLANFELVAVVDPDLDRARVLAGPDAQPSTSVEAVVHEIDAAVVAVPTQRHLDVGRQLLTHGRHVLMEKPIALSGEEATELIELAERHMCVLAVGHIERFNSAVVELPRFLQRPIHIECSRIGPYSARVSDGVIVDLMIHDLDIVLSLVGHDTAVRHISGVARSIKSASEDIASATLVFDSGLTATFNTSRLGQQKTRLIEITQDDSTLLADLLRRDVTIHRMSRSEYLSGDGARYRQSSVVEIPFLETAGEPLALELAQFAESILTGSAPRVTGDDGRRALELAQAIEREVVRG
jgi:predicted dehydrogenase